jgi:hypothetical protein
MTADYGVRSRHRGLSPVQITLGIGVVLLLGALGWNLARYWSGQIAETREWTIPGPPCPALSRQALIAAGLQAAPEGDLRGFGDLTSDYDGVRFSRRFGYMSCAAVRENGGYSLDSHPVCQFTRPGVVTVASAKGVFYFNTGSNAPATVSVKDGVPACVLANRFKLNRNYLFEPATT